MKHRDYKKSINKKANVASEKIEISVNKNSRNVLLPIFASKEEEKRFEEAALKCLHNKNMLAKG